MADLTNNQGLLASPPLTSVPSVALCFQLRIPVLICVGETARTGASEEEILDELVGPSDL